MPPSNLAWPAFVVSRTSRGHVMHTMSAKLYRWSGTRCYEKHSRKHKTISSVTEKGRCELLRFPLPVDSKAHTARPSLLLIQRDDGLPPKAQWQHRGRYDAYSEKSLFRKHKLYRKPPDQTLRNLRKLRKNLKVARHFLKV